MTTALPNTQTKTNSSSALAQEAVVETNFEAASASFDKKQCNMPALHKQ